jgi:hypothetical protein
LEIIYTIRDSSSEFPLVKNQLVKNLWFFPGKDDMSAFKKGVAG